MNERTFQWNSKKFDFNENVKKKNPLSQLDMTKKNPQKFLSGFFPTNYESCCDKNRFFTLLILANMFWRLKSIL